MSGKFRKYIRKMLRHCSGDCGTAMLEYALLLASLVVFVNALAPGSRIYQTMAGDLQVRLWLISMPIF